MRLNFREYISNLDIFEWMKQFWVLFMNDCMWAIFHSKKLMRIMVNHQIHNTHTIIGTVQARLEDLKHNASEFNRITLRLSRKARYACLILCCVWEFTTPLQTKHGRRNFPKNTTRQHQHNYFRWKKFKHSWIPRNGPISKRRIIFMSMFDDMEYWITDNQQTCLANATQVVEHAKQFNSCH